MHSNVIERLLFFCDCFRSHFPENLGKYRTHDDSTLIQVMMNLASQSNKSAIFPLRETPLDYN